MTEQNGQSNPGLIPGHVKMAGGIAEAAIGSVTGSESWKSAGEANRQAGIDEMKAASADRDPQQSGYGKVEQMAGKAVGCEGMEEEGSQSTKQ